MNRLNQLANQLWHLIIEGNLKLPRASEEQRKEFGKVLRSAREDDKIKVGELAEKCKVTRITVFYWETGKHLPDENQAKLIKNFLGVDIHHYISSPAPFVFEVKKEQITKKHSFPLTPELVGGATNPLFSKEIQL